MKQGDIIMRLTLIHIVILTAALITAPQQMAAAQQSGETAAQVDVSPAQDTDQPPPQAIRAAQSLLAALGYDPGPAGGVWTSSTKAAYQAFLRDMGLPSGDTLTPQALRALQSAAAQQGVAPTGDRTTTAGTRQTPAPSQPDVPPSVSPDMLHNAAQTGDIELLTATLAAGVNVNARDSRGRTALMHAVDKGYLLLVSALLEAQADVNVRAPDGATVLFMAAAHGHTEIIEVLMKAGADVSIRGPQGKTPVEVAITRYGDSKAARENGEPPAVLVLLDGKTWAQAQAELERNRQEAEASIRKLPEEMVSIPAGKFRMGSRKGYDDEKPVRRVTVPAFKLGKYEVTVSQFSGFVEATGYRTDAEQNTGGDAGCFSGQPDGNWDWIEGRSWRNPGYPVQGGQPVVCVSWNDTQAFIKWLNGKTNGNYRLPTEAEWEYAARAGSKTKYSWGDDIGNNRANCDNSYCGDSWEYTAPVGSFPANAWGLHDMHGNVLAWVQDCWNDNYKGAPKDGSARTSGDCRVRVLRGGAWNSTARYLRSANRLRNDRTTRFNSIGFRLAQDE